MQDFKKLKVWEKAHSLTIDIYKITKRLPKQELYGITNQIRRASVSIATNISEGCGRESRADFARFLQIAVGSASEVEYLLLLSNDLNLLEKNEMESLNNKNVEIRMMLTKLIQKLKTDN